MSTAQEYEECKLYNNFDFDLNIGLLFVGITYVWMSFMWQIWCYRLKGLIGKCNISDIL